MKLAIVDDLRIAALVVTKRWRRSPTYAATAFWSCHASWMVVGTAFVTARFADKDGEIRRGKHDIREVW